MVGRARELSTTFRADGGSELGRSRYAWAWLKYFCDGKREMENE